MAKNILYVASCTDMGSETRLSSTKVGIAENDADKRIRLRDQNTKNQE